MQLVDRGYKSGLNGFSLRPWVLKDHQSDCVISDLSIKNVGDAKGVYCPVWSAADYLIAKRGDGTEIDPKKYPNGYWYKSLTIRNVTVDGVKRTDGASHTDGIFTAGCTLPGVKVDMLVENYLLKNTDLSVMGMLIQPGNWGSFILRNVQILDGQQRVCFKPNSNVDLLKIENCPGRLQINPPYVSEQDQRYVGTIKKIEVINSPNLDLNGFKGTGTEIVYLSQPTVPIPSPVPTPVPVPKKIKSVTIIYSDGSTKTI